MSVNLTKLADLFNRQDGEPILATQGTIKRVDRYRSGVGSNKKPYAFQDILLTEDGVDFMACFADRDPVPPESVGQRITLLCHKGDRGFTGVKIRSRNVYANGQRTDQIENVLWVTQTAQVTGVPNRDPETNQPVAGYQQQRPATTTAQAARPATQHSQSAPDASRALGSAKSFVGRNRAVAILALRVAYRLKMDFEQYHQYEMPDVLLANVFNSLMFGASSSGVTVGLPTNLDYATLTVPADPPPKAEPPPPPPPPPEPPPQPPAALPPPPQDDVPM